MRIHARYQREEILAALDFPRMPNSLREGVWYSPDHNVDAFFITLKKSEADYSPTTMYADYPISPDAVPLGVAVDNFRAVTDRSALRQRNEHRAAVRPPRAEGRLRHLAVPVPRPGDYVSHSGDRPIAITWRLQDADADRLLQPDVRSRTLVRGNHGGVTRAHGSSVGAG